MESQVATVALLSRETNIPVPITYGYDTTADNEIGAPYICMSFISGRTVAEMWFNKASAPTSLEERRARTLVTLGEAVAQLAVFSFSKIGSLDRQPDEALAVGPCYNWQDRDDGTVGVGESGPYDTINAYLADHFVSSDNGDEWDIAQAKIMDVVLPLIP